MEYLDLIKKFWAINEENPLSSSVSSVYLFLLERWDRNERKDFELSDVQISKNLKMDRKTVKSSKEALRNLGFVGYQVTNGFPTFYKIITDYTRKSSVTAQQQGIKKEKNQRETISKTYQSTTQESQIQGAEKKETTSPINIPSLEEFMDFAKTLEVYEENMDFQIKSKYETWVSDGWKNGYGVPIKSWKSQLMNAMMHFKNNKNGKSIFNVKSVKEIPKINRPKSTYNE